MPTFETPEPILVIVELGVGDIRLVATDRADTVVDVRPTDPAKQADVAAADQTRVEYASGRLLIEAPKGWRRYTPFGGGESVDVRIDLPAGSQVRGEAGAAAVRTSGRLGEFRFKTGVGDIQLAQTGPLQLRTGGGNISVEQAAGPVEVRTGSGSVEIAGIDGTGVVKNSNGDTWIGEVGGEVRVSAANGKIVIDSARAGVVAKTACGDIRLGEVMRGGVRADTGFGKVQIGVREGVPAWLDLNTRFGHVRNELEATDRPAAGEEPVEVRAFTSCGDITVRRSALHLPGGEGA